MVPIPWSVGAFLLGSEDWRRGRDEPWPLASFGALTSKMVRVSFLSIFFSQMNFFKKNLCRNCGSIKEMVMLAVNWRWPPSFPSLSTCTEFSFVFFRLLISVSDWFVASDFTDVEIGVSRSAILQESGFEFLRNLAPFFQQFVQNGGNGQQGGKSLPSIWKWMDKNFAAP